MELLGEVILERVDGQSRHEKPCKGEIGPPAHPLGFAHRHVPLPQVERKGGVGATVETRFDVKAVFSEGRAEEYPLGLSNAERKEVSQVVFSNLLKVVKKVVRRRWREIEVEVPGRPRLAFQPEF